MTFIAILSLIILFLISYNLISNKRNNDKARKVIVERWAKTPDIISEEDLVFIQSYFINLQNGMDSKACIDDITWNDLDMDIVFGRINNTLSTAGEEYLYNLIRQPVFNEDELGERNRLIELFQKDEDTRKETQFILARLGKVRHLNISDFFCGTNNLKYKNRILYYLLAFLFISSTMVLFINIQIGTAAIALMFIINSTVYYRRKNEIESKLAPMSYTIQMISVANSLTRLKLPGMERYQERLKSSVSKLKKVNNIAFNILCRAQDPITEYIKVLFMLELIAFEKSYNFLAGHCSEIRNVFEVLGYLDSMISIASFREFTGYYCKPQIVVQEAGKSMNIEAADLYHPLIRDPKPYSFCFSKPVLLTGSNASGKSTFLKTAAINAILAQTIFTALARRFSLSPLIVYTSIALKDNLNNKESYFIVELKSLKRVIDASCSGIPCLCIVDEVLRGTNTVERISASSEVLNSLKNSNCMCIAATHDIELTSILEDIYENYHFREEITEDNDVIFNYMLYPGKSSTKNALKLLKAIGYSSATVSRAQHRSDTFLAEGVWEKVCSL